jgi:hypothetical protein
VNSKKGYAADIMDEFLREGLKDEGRVEKIREKRRTEVSVANTAKKLKEMTKVTSGGLASHGMYHIVAGTHQEIRARKALRLAGDAEVQQKRAAREDVINLKRQAARNKRLVTARSVLPKEYLITGIAALKQLGDSPQKKNRQDTEAQLQRRELRSAKERELKRKYLSNVDIRVLLEELQQVGDANEAVLLPKSREELLAELERRRNRSNVTINELP